VIPPVAVFSWATTAADIASTHAITTAGILLRQKTMNPVLNFDSKSLCHEKHKKLKKKIADFEFSCAFVAKNSAEQIAV
jgi:ribonuclease HII